ncbi:hypothetical protein [Mastigocoleus testarum]|uniref:Uncharacterized protein n=1 Tax=Mastigocoleus testarum BC008 TaxID=371196 RepID=A0A0V7ZWE6_9CYAN|nr:hypothetical protein [Mastigocoleus testarum]KST68964.1 hypothetical protein BC008_02490 [Mastigocoleus testarum BC008]
MKKYCSYVAISLLISFGFILKAITPLGMRKAVAIPVPNAYINFAGAGGDFKSRQATFQVSDQTTITKIEKNLRLYEVHLAKMIELTYDFCEDRAADYIVHWNYQADDGKIFMGNFPLSCELARKIFQRFGTGEREKVTLDYRGKIVYEHIATLALDSKNSKQFASLVQTLKPQCIEVTKKKICPGDRPTF